MRNYVLSETYRILRVKMIYIVSSVCLLLMLLLAIVLNQFGSQDVSFPYASASFYYSNVLGFPLLIIFIAFLFSTLLTRKNRSVVGQSLSLGYERTTIFWSKFLLQLGFFVILCILGMIVLVGAGVTLLEGNNTDLYNLTISIVNLAPLIFAGFCLSYVLNLLEVSESISIFILFFIFNLVRWPALVLFRAFPGLRFLNDYLPGTLFSDNLSSYMANSIEFDLKMWTIGMVLALVFLLIGRNIFKKIDI